MGKKFGFPFSWKRALAGLVLALLPLGLGVGAAAAVRLLRF